MRDQQRYRLGGLTGIPPGPLLIGWKHHKEHLTSSQSISNLCTQMEAHSPCPEPKAGGLGIINLENSTPSTWIESEGHFNVIL